jgi:hypothetical protein
MWIGTAVAAVWIAVGAMSIFAPDLISGTEQEHIPLAALLTWLWGGLATGLILLAGAVGETSADRWRSVAIVIAVMWAVVAVAGIWSPVLETGTDPTRVPLAVIFAPVAGAIGTAFVCVYAAGSRRSDR